MNSVPPPGSSSVASRSPPPNSWSSACVRRIIFHTPWLSAHCSNPFASSSLPFFLTLSSFHLTHSLALPLPALASSSNWWTFPWSPTAIFSNLWSTACNSPAPPRLWPFSSGNPDLRCRFYGQFGPWLQTAFWRVSWFRLPWGAGGPVFSNTSPHFLDWSRLANYTSAPDTCARGVCPPAHQGCWLGEWKSTTAVFCFSTTRLSACSRFCLCP